MSIHAPTNIPPFYSPKCVAPIATADVLVTSALIWASLDGSIMSISMETVARTEEPAFTDCLLLETPNDTLVLDVLGSAGEPEARRRDERTWRAFGWMPLTLLPTEIEREPRFVNASRIWRERRTSVPNLLRFQILDRLREDGPLRVHELLTGLHADRDPLAALFSLACGGELTIDLDGALGRDTVVRLR
jgi:hypothetical protein